MPEMGMEWDWGCPISDEWAGMGSLLNCCIPFLPIVWADGKYSPFHPISEQEFPFHPIFDFPEFIVKAGADKGRCPTLDICLALTGSLHFPYPSWWLCVGKPN
jgi:hypothetical protein